MLNRLNSFCSHTITNIQTLIDVHYAFYRHLDSSSYIIDLLYKDKFFCDNIENVGNERLWYRKSCL